MLRLKRFAFVLTCAAGLCQASTRADDLSGPNPADHQWAVLIGCEQYARATKLRYTVNDVRQIADTLHVYGGYGRDHLLEMTDDASNERHKPLKTNIEVELKRYFKKLKPEDVLLVYFSGHGFRDAEGKMFLAPLDVDPDNAASTGVAVEWLREQIAGCQAGFKLLVLDACHAGSEKGDDDDTGIAARELGEPFKNLDKVVTLASSAADEKSQIWEQKEQSLFSFWLNQGLKGHADGDSDGVVDIDELYKFVSRSVTRTADARFSRPQTPVRIVRSGIRDVPAVLHLQPQRLKTVLADMAELLAETLDERRVKSVGVLEFINDTRRGEMLGADFGPLGKWCAAEFERQLGDAGAGKFGLIDSRRLQNALSKQSFKLDDLASSDKLRKLSVSAGGMPALVLGTLKARTGDVIHLQCKLEQTEGVEKLAEVGGTARITESEWAMFGHSAVVEPSVGPPVRRTGIAARQASLRVIRQLDQAAT
ncbi:MAG TPA: caspase family protein, partial [Pirellulales bacterium]|nr:caspase family protein [Pirellulales bacterium]